jgi:hypothetical protein
MYVNDGKVIGANFWGIEKAGNNGFLPHYIYITSDEDIKTGDLIFESDTNTINVAGNDYVKNEFDFKIILTTDPKLIADDVQAIDNEFLEWFIKNPSCEFVEVKENNHLFCKHCNNLHSTFGDGVNCDVCRKQSQPYIKTLGYKIIIPQEEPKEVICRDKFGRVIQDGDIVDVQMDGEHKVYKKEDGQLYFKPLGKEDRVSSYFSNDLILTTIASKNIADIKKEIANKKQGTLEEAAEIDLSNLCYYDKRNPDYIPYNEDDLTEMPKDCYCDNCFYGRTKLTEQLIKQGERMYSEEDLRQAFKAGIALLGPNFYGVNTLLQKHEDDFIEQFKKK